MADIDLRAAAERYRESAVGDDPLVGEIHIEASVLWRDDYVDLIRAEVDGLARDMVRAASLRRELRGMSSYTADFGPASLNQKESSDG